MRRGQIWWADLPLPIGYRPVLLLMRNDAYSYREQVIVSPITTNMRGLRTEVHLGDAEGLTQASVANLDVIMTISNRLLDEYISEISPFKIREMDDALRFALGLLY